MKCQADRCKYLDFLACEDVARFELRGRWSLFNLCGTCKDRLIACRRSDGDGWTIRRLASIRLPLAFLISIALGALVAAGCGDVASSPADVGRPSADATGAAGGTGGTVAELGGRSGGPGGSSIPEGGAPGSGGASGETGAGGAPVSGGAGAPGADAGAAWPTCAHVAAVDVIATSHCFRGCRDAAGVVLAACELSDSDAAGWKPYAAPLFCVPTSGALPRECN